MGTAKILSTSSEAFESREQAGRQLAVQLMAYKEKNAVVLGIPRGGMVVAMEVAERLKGELDIVLTHKLGAPMNPELAVGAVCEDGTMFVDQMIADSTNADREYLKREKQFQLARMEQRVRTYRHILAKADLNDRIVIVTDDGVATGATMQAALWAIRQEKPQRLIGALPVGPADTIDKLCKDCDELVCLRTPPYFMALGRFYMNFRQVEDEVILDILKEEQQRRERKKREQI